MVTPSSQVLGEKIKYTPVIGDFRCVSENGCQYGSGGTSNNSGSVLHVPCSKPSKASSSDGKGLNKYCVVNSKVCAYVVQAMNIILCQSVKRGYKDNTYARKSRNDKEILERSAASKSSVLQKLLRFLYEQTSLLNAVDGKLVLWLPSGVV